MQPAAGLERSRACNVMGKFHGLIAPTTPTGCLIVMCRLPATELHDLTVSPFAFFREPFERIS